MDTEKEMIEKLWHTKTVASNVIILLASNAVGISPRHSMLLTFCTVLVIVFIFTTMLWGKKETEKQNVNVPSEHLLMEH